MRQWHAKTKDGNEFSEDNKKWDDIKSEVVELKLENNGQIISLPKNMEEYIQAKSASSILGSGQIEIESRYIAFKLGNNIVRIRVDEKTNNISACCG